MKRLNLTQGTAEWRAARSNFPCASEAPIIMGASRHMTRAEMLRLKAAGMEREFSDFVQRMVLDKGHEVEAPARAITAQQIGESLYPVTALDDAGEYLASFDGITMAEDLLMEHKQWSDELAAAIEAGATEFPDGQEWQLEQQLLVAQDAEGVIFVCSDGTEERRVQMEYRRVPGRAEQLRAGWAQFHADLAAGVAPPAPPKVVAEPMEALPAVRLQMEGALKVVSNLDKLEPVLRAFIDRIPAKPSTDLEFAHTEAACKALKRIEDELDAAEASALGSLDAVEQMQRLKKTLHALARHTRLQREKLVEARKLEIRTEEIARGKQALADFITVQNGAIGKAYFPPMVSDFPSAIKGKKTVQSVRDAIDQHLADLKLAGSETTARIITNMRALQELAADYKTLFPDTATLVLKAPDDCRAQITSRIAEHQAAEQRRAAALAEQERARIRAEEEARAREQAQREQAAAEQQRQDAAAQAALDARLATAQQREDARQAEIAGAVLLVGAAKGDTYLPTEPLADLSGAGNVVPMPTKAPAAAASPPTLRLGEIQKRIAPLSIDAAGLAALGFPFAKQEGAAKLWHEAAFPAIVDAAIKHLALAKLKQLEAA